MVLLLGAMQAEIVRIPRLMSRTDRRDWQRFVLYRGMLDGADVAVGCIGVGKVLAAAITQHLVETLQPRAVLLTGIAGALKGDLSIGDIVIGRDCVQHDFDVTALGFALGEIPYSGYRAVTCAPGLVACAAAASPPQGRGHVGRILSGDHFVDADEKRRLGAPDSQLCGDVVDMESAAVALVCALNKVPLLIVRTVSDTLDGRRPKRFARLVKSCGDTAVSYYRRLVSAGVLDSGTA